MTTKVDIQMPIRHGGFVAAAVIERLFAQDVPVTFYVDAGEDLEFTDRETALMDTIAKSPEHAARMRKTTQIAVKRNRLRLRGESPYIYLADNDILLPDAPIFGGMIEAFERHPELGAVGLCYQENSTHVACGSMMLRRCDFMQIGELRDTATSCVCSYIERQLGAMKRRVVPIQAFEVQDLRAEYSQKSSSVTYQDVRVVARGGILTEAILTTVAPEALGRTRLFIETE